MKLAKTEQVMFHTNMLFFPLKLGKVGNDLEPVLYWNISKEGKLPKQITLRERQNYGIFNMYRKLMNIMRTDNSYFEFIIL